MAKRGTNAASAAAMRPKRGKVEVLAEPAEPAHVAEEPEKQEEGPDVEELMLRSALFGYRPNQEERKAMEKVEHAKDNEADGLDEVPDEALFKMDAAGDDDDSDEDRAGEDNESSQAGAAWADSDDEDLEVDLTKSNRLRKLRRAADETVVSGREYASRLREQHDKLYKGKANLDWAKLGKTQGEEEDDEDEKRLKQTSSLFLSDRTAAKQRARMERSGRIVLTKLRDANCAEQSRGVVLALDFHKTTPELLLTAGMDKTLRLFRLSADQKHTKLQSVHFGDMPIYEARFSGQSHVLISGRRPFFYSYEVETGSLRKVRGIFGREEERSYESMAATQESDLVAMSCSAGIVSILNRAEGFKEAFAVKLTSSRAAAIEFEGDRTLFAYGKDGDVYKWDLRKASKPVWRRKDEGVLHGTALACRNGMYATGDGSGIVSLYHDASGERVRSFEQLTTSIDSMAFSPSDGQLMAFSSRKKKDAIRLVHVPTAQVVKNWPPQSSSWSVGNVTALALSHQGGLLACGNDHGKVLLWRVEGFA